jgi:hypothetical protein
MRNGYCDGIEEEEEVMADIIDRTDRNDLIALAESYLPMARCPGGRIIMDGYICAHCGKDPTDGKCGKPKRRRNALD